MNIKIGEGTFREVFIDENNPSLCIKKLKEIREKYYFGIKVSYKLEIYSLLKYGIKDLNEYDYKILKKVQKIIPNNIPEHIDKTDEGLIQSIIKNYDGEISKNITEYEGKLGEDFFIKLEKLINYLIQNGIEPMDILHNTIIQEYEKGKIKPILFDFKRIGGRTYIFQPWLMISKELRKKKVYRRLDKLKDIFK